MIQSSKQSQSGSASFEESVRRVSSRSTVLSQTLNRMDIHRKEPPEPVSKDHSLSRDSSGPVSKDDSLSSDAPEPVFKDRSPSTEASETVHKHSDKGNIPSASTSTSSQAQTQTSRPNTRSQPQTSTPHHNTRSHIHQAHTPPEPIPKAKSKRGAASKGKEPEFESGDTEDEARFEQGGKRGRRGKREPAI